MNSNNKAQTGRLTSVRGSKRYHIRICKHKIYQYIGNSVIETFASTQKRFHKAATKTVIKIIKL